MARELESPSASTRTPPCATAWPVRRGTRGRPRRLRGSARNGGPQLGYARADRVGRANRSDRYCAGRPPSADQKGAGVPNRLGPCVSRPFASPAERRRNLRGQVPRGRWASQPSTDERRARPRSPAVRGVAPTSESPSRRAPRVDPIPQDVHRHGNGRFRGANPPRTAGHRPRPYAHAPSKPPTTSQNRKH